MVPVFPAYLKGMRGKRDGEIRRDVSGNTGARFGKPDNVRNLTYVASEGGTLNITSCTFDNLRGVILNGYDLAGVDFGGKDLTGARFRGALNNTCCTFDSRRGAILHGYDIRQGWILVARTSPWQASRAPISDGC